jgi:hypothetical protein
MARVKQVARFRVDENGNVVPIVRPVQSPAERCTSHEPAVATIKKQGKAGKAGKTDKKG